jgi:Carbohydrate esterase, sialic acid-specific acetylesterase
VRYFPTLAASVVLFPLTYFVGVYSVYSGTWPVPQLMGLARDYRDADTIRTDKFARLLTYPGKTEVSCPVQDATTAVYLVAGQSNAANYQGQKYQSQDDRVINFSEGRCYIAGSPLLGADNRNGESWTLLGTKLIRSGLYTRVIVIPAAVGGSSIHRWAKGSDLNEMLIGVIRSAKKNYTLTGILFDQGATDTSLGTSEQTYRMDMKSLIDSIHAEGVAAPFYIVQCTMQLTPSWTEDNPISRAQRSLENGKDILAGPNTDHDIPAADRFDGLHFSASGQVKFTDEWVELLRKHRGADQ